MLTVWGRRNSTNVQKVMWTIGEIGMAYERHDVGGSFGGLDSEQFFQLNPNKLIPVLKDGKITIWESHAIVRYLAATYDKGGIWPDEPSQRAHADQWMDWMHTTISEHFFIMWLGMMFTPEADRDMHKINAAAERLGKIWERLDLHLLDKPYITGEYFTVADIPLGIVYHRYHELNILRPEYTNILRWYGVLKRRRAYKEHVLIPFGKNLTEWLEYEKRGANQT